MARLTAAHRTVVAAVAAAALPPAAAITAAAAIATSTSTSTSTATATPTAATATATAATTTATATFGGALQRAEVSGLQAAGTSAPEIVTGMSLELGDGVPDTARTAP